MRRLRRAAALPFLLLLAALAVTTTTAAAAAAKAPVAAPALPPNVTAEMAKGGCKAFADLIAASPDASSTYQSAVEGGMTVFCPSDDAVRAFLPRYRNLSADAKAELLLFHAVPVHYSLGSLKSNNGPMNTLATDGAARNFNFTVQNQGDVVTIRTAAGAGAPARVKSTAVDKDPLAIYVISAVVEPVELFKPAPSPTPAPAPAPAAAADAPKAGKATARQRHTPPAVADAPGPAAAEDNAAPVDQKDAKKSAAAAAGAPCDRWWLARAAALAAAVAAASALA